MASAMDQRRIGRPAEVRYTIPAGTPGKLSGACVTVSMIGPDGIGENSITMYQTEGLDQGASYGQWEIALAWITLAMWLDNGEEIEL